MLKTHTGMLVDRKERFCFSLELRGEKEKVKNSLTVRTQFLGAHVCVCVCTFSLQPWCQTGFPLTCIATLQCRGGGDNWRCGGTN